MKPAANTPRQKIISHAPESTALVKTPALLKTTADRIMRKTPVLWGLLLLLNLITAGSQVLQLSLAGVIHPPGRDSGPGLCHGSNILIPGENESNSRIALICPCFFYNLGTIYGSDKRIDFITFVRNTKA